MEEHRVDTYVEEHTLLPILKITSVTDSSTCACVWESMKRKRRDLVFIATSHIFHDTAKWKSQILRVWNLSVSWRIFCFINYLLMPLRLFFALFSEYPTDLGLFSTKSLVEANPDHPVEVRSQVSPLLSVCSWVKTFLWWFHVNSKFYVESLVCDVLVDSSSHCMFGMWLCYVFIPQHAPSQHWLWVYLVLSCNIVPAMKL